MEELLSANRPETWFTKSKNGKSTILGTSDDAAPDIKEVMVKELP